MSSEIILEKKPITWYGVLAIIAVSALGLAALALFAWQTWQFVDWLFPQEQFLYKVLAVCNFDIMSVVWISLELFVELTHGSKNTAFIAGGFDFVLSIICTVVQMVRESQEASAGSVDSSWLTVAYVVIILALVINLVCLMCLFRFEWPYISGQKIRFYPVTPDKPKGPRGGTTVREEAPAQLEAPKLTIDDIIRVLEERERNKPQPEPVAAGAARRNRPFLASQGQQQASQPKKPLPPLRRKGFQIKNPFRKSE